MCQLKCMHFNSNLPTDFQIDSATPPVPPPISANLSSGVRLSHRIAISDVLSLRYV